MRKTWDNSVENAGESARATQPVPSSVLIGGVHIAPATVLAPMAGVTDTVFRRFIRNLGGCGLIMTEFTSADGVLRKKDQKVKRYLHFYEDEHPISAQLFGSDPQVMAEAARLGFKKCLVPRSGMRNIHVTDIEPVPVSTLREVVRLGLVGKESVSSPSTGEDEGEGESPR